MTGTVTGKGRVTGLFEAGAGDFTFSTLPLSLECIGGLVSRDREKALLLVDSPETLVGAGRRRAPATP